MSTTTDRKRPKRRRRFGRITSRKWPSGRRTWRAIWFCKLERRRMSRSFDSEKDAKDFLAEIERRVVAQVYDVPPTILEADHQDEEAQRAARPRRVPTLVAYAQDVINRRFDAVLARGTMGIYRAALRAWKTYFGKRDGRPAVRVDQITPSMWLDYRSWRATHRNSSFGEKTTVSARTLNADLQCAVRILNEAMIDGHIEANPLAGLSKLREPRKPRRYLTKSEIVRLLDACPKDFRPLAVAMVYSGARRSELTALRWGDIDFEHGKITLVRSKTGSTDLLDLHPKLRTALLRLRLRRKKPKPDVHVFLSRRGMPFTNISKSWAIALKGAGLRAVNFRTPISTFTSGAWSGTSPPPEKNALILSTSFDPVFILARSERTFRLGSIQAPLPFVGWNLSAESVTVPMAS